MENLTSNLERCCGKTPTDWITVAKLFSSRVVSTPPPIEDLSNVLDHIRPIKKLSENQFGNFYQARLANSVLCILRLKPIGANESSRNSLDCVAGCILSSPFITRYYASFSTANAYAIVIEHLDGIELQNILSVQARVSEEDLACYLGQLVLALEHLHRRGFICRSLQVISFMPLESRSGFASHTKPHGPQSTLLGIRLERGLSSAVVSSNLRFADIMCAD